MSKNFRKLLSLILVISLILPGMVFANEPEVEDVRRVTLEEIMKNFRDSLNEEEREGLLATYEDEDEVRIIVELSGRPVIVHATDSGQKYGEMSHSNIKGLESNLLAEQESVKSQINSRFINMTYIDSFTTVFNGFSGEVKFKDIPVIEKIRGVEKVYISTEYERPVIEPNMGSSNSMVGSPEAWSKYKGEGTVIAIIDSGVDPSHKDFVLSEDTVVKIKPEDVTSSLPGMYFTKKVPYGYNYYDQSLEILDLGPDATEHGMHVAGTAVANGLVKGVAPESQVLAMKVFSNDPLYATTFDDIYMGAIEDAINLKADAINMSLGSTASFYVEDSAINKAITNATENGVIVSTSSGNSGYLGNGYWIPFVEDPDYGLVGSPSLSKDSISVASVENNMVSASYLQFETSGELGVLPDLTVIIGGEAYDLATLNKDVDLQIKYVRSINEGVDVIIKYSNNIFVTPRNILVDSEELPKTVIYIDEDGNSSLISVLPGEGGESEVVKIAMNAAGPLTPSDILKGDLEFLYCGLGAPEEFEGKDLKGKIALIIRGELAFTEKIMNAQNVGAAGVIVYNNEGGGDELINMQYPDDGKIPAVAIGYNDGLKLLELEEKNIRFPEGVYEIPNVSAGEMSDFSSWGTTPTLELKPEITAPGGMIYSTFQNDSYGLMSGTSMSTPHVAGGAALVKQHIKESGEYGALTLEEESRLTKVLLMNTAEILINDDSYGLTPFSPRQQGAGLMKVNGAVSTPVRVVNKTSREAKVELKDFETKSFELNLEAINSSDEDITYNVKVDVLADLILDGWKNILESRDVKATITGEGPVVVSANGTADINIRVDFSEDTEVYRNMFVDGFVRLVESTDTHSELSVPFTGFYGDWEEPRILDTMEHEEGMEGVTDSYYEFSFATYRDGNLYRNFPGKHAISPGTEFGKLNGNDNIVPVLSFLRNAGKVEFNILNEDGNKVRGIRTENFVRKNYIDGSRQRPKYSLVPNRIWDGEARGKIAEDGLYIYEVRTQIQGGETWQTKEIPVYVDTVPPEVTDISYNEETGMLGWNIIDETSGLIQVQVYINGQRIKIITPEEEQVDFELDVKDIMDGILEEEGDNLIEVIAIDHALNIGDDYLVASNDTEIPYIYLLTPDLLDIYNESKVLFEGYVLKNNVIDSVKIDGEEVEFKFSDRILHMPGTASQAIVSGFVFEHELTLDDGYHQISVEAESLAGTKASIVRRFFVDSTAPVLEVTAPETVTTETTVDLNITMSDNFNSLLLYVYDSEEFRYDGSQGLADIANPTEIKEITVPVLLDLGENTIPVTLIDEAGNRTVVEVIVTREENPEIEVEEPKIELDAPEDVTVEVKFEEDEITGEILNFDPTDRTPVKVTLTKGTEEYSNVRVIVEGLDNGIQLIAYDGTGNKWYNIAKAGWGAQEGFPLEDAETDVFVVVNRPGTYAARIKLIDVSGDANQEITSFEITIIVE